MRADQGGGWKCGEVPMGENGNGGKLEWGKMGMGENGNGGK